MPCVRLREDVFMARADGLVVFLDLGADRYFALNSAFSARLAPVIEAKGEGADPETIRRLRRAGAAAEDDASGASDFSPTPWSPAIEGALPAHAEVAATASAAFCRWRAERELATHHLADIVRARRLAREQGAAEPPYRTDLMKAASLFVAARALRGGRDACLKEALALLYFLGRGGVRADWVFAVKGAPFAAHCWVQLGDVVLNDTVDNVGAYTPIMVV